MAAAWRSAWFFALQALNYSVLTWNFRAVAQARYFYIGASDLAAAFLAFTLMAKISDPDTKKSRPALAGYVLGGTCGACGSMLSAWVSTMVFRQRTPGSGIREPAYQLCQPIKAAESGIQTENI